MKWLFVCLALLLLVNQASAGEDPYVGIVDNDSSGQGWNFYFTVRHQQFMFDQESLGIPVAGEQFRSQTASTRREVCNETLTGGLPNAKTPAGNSGFYEWWIRLPKKPSGEINIVIECGVLKPGGTSIELCAAETGERVGFGTCVRQEVDPGVNPVINTALPRVTSVVYPGPFNAFPPFHLTAFKNPSSYTLAFDATQAMSNNGNSQVLDGGSNARILLKACMDKTIVTKLPVTGQVNALGETETDLEAGDLIQVRLDIPRQNSVDVYCHRWSTRLMGVGESSF